MVTQWSTPVPEKGTRMRADKVTTATTAGGTVGISARPGRISATVKNEDAAITVYVGAGDETISSTDNSRTLLFGESETFYTDQSIKFLAASGAPVVSYVERW